MTTKLAKGTAVVSLADGVRLGVVDRVYLDPERLELVGFSFHQGRGLFSAKQTGLIEIGDVRGFGPDAVTVDDVSVVHCDMALMGRDGDLIDLDDLLQRQVLTEGGLLLGDVVSVNFGEDSHRLIAVEVASNDQVDHWWVACDQVVHIGAELIVVAEPSPAGTERTSDTTGANVGFTLVESVPQAERLARAV